MPSTVGPLFALRGRVVENWSQDPWVPPSQFVLESAGGEYFACEFASPGLREKMSDGNEHTVFVVQILREDAESLYAFENLLERALFLEVRDFDSVGPKTAALLISQLGSEGLREVLERGQKPGTKIAGLGPKTFEKILVGLKQNKEKFLQLFAKAPGQRRVGAGLNFEAFATKYENAPEGLPLGVVQAMEKLGLRSQDVHQLFLDLSREVEGFAQLGHVDMIRQLLQAWGRAKARGHQAFGSVEG